MKKSFDEHKEVFAERLKDLMNGQSVLQFSKLVNIPERTINSWLRKVTTPRMEYIILLAEYFGVTTDYLLGLED